MVARDDEVPGMDYYLSLRGVDDCPYNRTMYRHLAAMATELRQNGYEVGIAFMWVPTAEQYSPFICYEVDEHLAPVVMGTSYDLLRSIGARCQHEYHDCDILYSSEEEDLSPYEEAEREAVNMGALERLAEELAEDGTFEILDDLFVEGGDEDDG